MSFVFLRETRRNLVTVFNKENYKSALKNKIFSPRQKTAVLNPSFLSEVCQKFINKVENIFHEKFDNWDRKMDFYLKTSASTFPFF